MCINKYGNNIIEIMLLEDTEDFNIDDYITPNTTLSDKQKKALKLAYDGSNIFITGPGGVGKSFLIREITKIIESKWDDIQITATTGCAAELLENNAKTIHSWSRVWGDINNSNNISRILKDKIAKKRWNEIDVLVIDEISMMSKKYFDTLNDVGQKLRNCTEPFGGIQVIACGDFYQLPPVEGEYCFESAIWNHMFPTENVIELSKIYRQRDKQFQKILRHVRNGRISESTWNILNSRKLENCIIDNKEEQHTIISPLVKDCNHINKKKMDKLSGEAKIFEIEICNLNTSTPTYIVDNEIDYLKSSIQDKLCLKVGAKVLCTANLDLISPQQIVNGSQGVITRFSDNEYPIVKFGNGRTLEMKPYPITSDNIEGLSIKYIPLIPCWAITTHKSQGITLDSAMINARE